MPRKQPTRGRLGFNDGSCVRLRPEHANRLWGYDFVCDRTHDGRKCRMLTVIDEYTRRCLAVSVQRRLRSGDVLDCLADLMTEHGVPGHIRSDNESEFTAKAVRRWIRRLGARTLFVEPGSPWENGYNEGFNGKLRDECSMARSWRRLRKPGCCSSAGAGSPPVPAAQLARLPNSGPGALATGGPSRSGSLVSFQVAHSAGADHPSAPPYGTAERTPRPAGPPASGTVRRAL